MLRAGLGLILLGMIFGTATPTQAQRARTEPKAEGLTFLDPKEAGPDFSIQGEYVTDAGAAHKLGVQVPALGDAKFQVIILAGGLPGAGWDGKSRVELNAVREGATAKMTAANGYEGSITEGSLSLKGPDGAIFLKKIERTSPRAGAKPPQGATILFDGANADAWQGGQIDKRGLLESGSKTKKLYQNFTLHVEYLLPFKPLARDQERGNSGIYMQDRYEVQVLDSFGESPRFNGCGAIYRQHAPSLNMCYPPLQWQTYDIEFHAAKFDADGKKTKNAVVTVNHNGTLVQDHYEITSKTGAGAKEGPTPGAIQLQGHNNPVFYRNIWVIGE